MSFDDHSGWLFAHSGVTLAPLIGELAASEITSGTRVDVLEPYRLERFGQ
ncbi:MAG: hypothetical protein IIC24_06140 [Chloroflexi bacterium]|nr:hypothetical protein [Chloroflexota bacterium]